MYSRIRDIRKERGISQEYMADMLGVSQTTYGRMERQDIPFDVRHMKTVARYFNVSMDYLVGATDNRTPYPKGEEFEDE